MREVQKGWEKNETKTFLGFGKTTYYIPNLAERVIGKILFNLKETKYTDPEYQFWKKIGGFLKFVFTKGLERKTQDP